MREEIIRILKEMKPNEELADKTDLVSGRYLKSMDIMNLVYEIEENLGVEIPVEDIVPEHFESVDLLLELIGKLQG